MANLEWAQLQFFGFSALFRLKKQNEEYGQPSLAF